MKKEKKKDSKKDSLKLIRGNFLGLILIGIIVICIGVGFASSDGGASSWVSQNPSKIRAQKEEDQKIGVICMVSGVALILFSGFYYDHAKSKYKRDLEMMEAIKESNKTENEADKLKQLKEMYDSKLITEEEYEKKKKEILDKM